jgi:hypothetical protein
MKMKTIIMAVLTGVLIAGCRSGVVPLPLDGSRDENLQTLQAYVPAGTHAADAVTRMKRAGFSCAVQRNRTAQIAKGTTPIGSTGPMPYVYCTRAIPDTRNTWQILLILDGDDRVSEHTLSRVTDIGDRI